MLNDYEITRVEKQNEIGPIISLLRLVAFAVAIVCSIILVPSVINEVSETRSNFVDDSLKIRVVANSNTDADQQLKTEMVENLTPFFTKIQQNERANIENDEVYAQLATFVEKNYANEEVKINIGENLIPPKIDSHMFYPQYHYNSLVLTIGEGRGDNWWCSIFPNVCERSADKEKDEQEAKKADMEEEEKPKVTFIVWEWVKKLFA
ncbi:stage II sporulation protein R [Ureibacillus aquaedulcis]|uniref:Stage II sporulation protein R n=1 Tax=Ureibacillus aquaedulcis TaxID=3058421 RepID=A0ABT8GL09_9BACL|nr:stage II sporulation protein R [Ureibacillus sp. BA0131]MDN4492103.1 stage II sporulation protein R [Ureibacillus sp. BA0131]